MTSIFESIFTGAWNYANRPAKPKEPRTSLVLGEIIRDGELTKHSVGLTLAKRSEHVMVLGRTGSGKSSLVKFMASQDIAACQGFAYFDFHGDSTPFLLRTIAAEEKRTGEDLSEKLIVIEPGSAEFSVGINPLQVRGGAFQSFVQIAELSKIIKDRCGMENLGPQTDELLRNSLFALADSGLTLVDLPAFLTNDGYRASLMKNISNADVRAYFESRFDVVSDAMRRVMNAPVLNKVSAFISDPHFRHILGQTKSSFSLADAIDSGCWIILDLPKGRLGAQTATLASLFLAKLKSALFSRTNRDLFTVYADEVQNLVSTDGDIETMFSELRKFGVGVLAANQYLDQYPAALRSAVLALGTHVCFQLSSPDAEKMSTVMDGGKHLAETLRNLPQRHFVIKSGSQACKQAVVPNVEASREGFADLLNRSRRRFARRREAVETEILARQPKPQQLTKEALDEWE